MEPRHKTMIIFGLTTLSLLIALYVATRSIILVSFTELEEKQVKSNAARLRNAVFHEINVLDGTVDDWAAWDEAYAFIEDENKDFIAENLVESTFTSLRLNLILFVDTSGQVIWGRAYDLHTNNWMPMPAGIAPYLTRDNRLIAHPEPQSRVTGILNLKENPMLIASRPILTSLKEGPVRGALIMGRYLDSDEVQGLAGRMQLKVVPQAYVKKDMPDDFVHALDSLQGKDAVFVSSPIPDHISGYHVFSDIFGKPSIIFRVDQYRDLYKLGQRVLDLFLWSELAAGLLFTIINMLIIEIGLFDRMIILGGKLRHFARE